MPTTMNQDNTSRQGFFSPHIPPNPRRIFLVLFSTTIIVVVVILILRTLLQQSDDTSSQGYSSIFSPSQFNLPDTIAGYSILAVLNSDTTACIRPGVARVLLQATADESLASHNGDTVLQALEALGRDDIADWEILFVGTSVTINQITAENLRWNNQFIDGDCAQLGGPIRTQSPSGVPLS